MNKLIFTFTLFSAITFFPITSLAQAVPVFGNLGGKIIAIEICPESYGLMLTIATKPLFIPVNVLYEPFFSRLNMNFNPFLIGNEVVLQHTAIPVPCLKYSPYQSYTNGMAVGTITTFPFAGIGTSATPLIKVEKTEYPVAY